MTINKDTYKRLRIIKATLAAGDAGATQLLFTIDPTAPTGSFPSRDLFSQISIVDSSGAAKTGWTKSYNQSGVSAGILTIAHGSATFASGDVVQITATLL